MNRVESMQIDLDELQGLRNEVERNRAAIAELVGALKAIVDLDDGDKPDLWHFEAEFNAARAAITKHQQPTTTEKDPALYLCTKCGGANYGCGCDSLKNCTVPLYTTEKE